MKDNAAPLEEEGRKLKAEKEAMEGVNGQLLADANYWRDRYVDLIGDMWAVVMDYNYVDK